MEIKGDIKKSLFCNLPLSPGRLDATLYLIDYFKNTDGKDIIDIGFGKLFFYELMRLLKKDVNYTGIDLVLPKNTKITKNLTLIKSDINNFRSRKKFSTAVSLWVLEHIKEDTIALTKIHDLLLDNGRLIIAVPSTWTWPIEFGRHGYHYYSKKMIREKIQNSNFKVLKSYDAGGLLGIIFMLFYSWPRYLILIFVFPLYFFLNILKMPKTNWKDFSKIIINKTLYSYHSKPRFVSFHNKIIQFIVKLDNKFKIFPLSYIFILEKK